MCVPRFDKFLPSRMSRHVGRYLALSYRGRDFVFCLESVANKTTLDEQG